MQQSTVEIAAALRRLAESLESSDSTIVHLANEEIFIPSKADAWTEPGRVGSNSFRQAQLCLRYAPNVRQHNQICRRWNIGQRD